MKKTLFRMFGLVLLFALILQTAAPFGAISAEGLSYAPDPLTASADVSSDETAEEVPKAEAPVVESILKPEQIPYAVGRNSEDVSEFFRRAYEKETALNQVVFQRKDGAYQEYLFSYPVKYVAEDGSIRDISPTITATGQADYPYSATASDSLLRFGATAAAGVEYQSRRLNLSLRPAGNAVVREEASVSSLSVAQLEQKLLPFVNAPAEKSVSAGIFSSEGTALVDAVSYPVSRTETVSFLSAYSGFQVVLEPQSSPRERTVNFALSTNGLSVKKIDDAFFLCRSDGEAVGVIGNFETGTGEQVSLSVQEVVAGELYALSATIPQDLSVRPLTASFSEVYDSVQDATLYSSNQTAYGSSMHLFIGRLDPYSGIGRAVIAMKTAPKTVLSDPGLDVISAKLIVRDVMAEYPYVTLECREFTGSLWSESTATWNSVGGGNYGGICSSCSSYTTGYYYHFDITKLAQRWYSGASDWRKGIVLKGDSSWEASSTEIEKTLASVQYATTAYRPRFEFTYIDDTIDGVYYIENVDALSYLEVQNGGIKNLTNVWVNNRETALSDRLKQMWKVKRIPNSVYYTIRPYHKLDMALDRTGDNVDIYKIGTSDALDSVPTYAQWLITEGTYGLIISPAAAPDLAIWCDSPIPKTDVTVSRHDIGQDSMWTFYRINDPDHGVALYDTETQAYLVRPTKFVAVNETRTLSQQNLTYGAYQEGSNSQGLIWSSSDTAIATVDRSTGAVTGKSPGTVQITYVYGIVSYYYYLTVLPIPNGTYFLKNKRTYMFADIEGPTMANNQMIHQWEFRDYGSQKWIFTHVGDGYYTLRTDYTSTPFYLGVLGDFAREYNDIVLRSGTVTDGMKWKVEKTASGAYRIVSKLNSQLCFGPSDGSATNGARLTLGYYAEDNFYQDEWFIVRPAADLVAVDAEGHEHLSCLSISQGYLDSIGDGDVLTTIHSGSFTGTEYKDILKDCSISAIRAHGSVIYSPETGYPQYTSISLGKSSLYSHSPGNLASTDEVIEFSGSFGNLNLVLFIACSSGAGGVGARNLPTAIVEHGAETAIGFTDEINCRFANQWTENFFKMMRDGKTVKEAVKESTRYLDTVIVCGNENLRIVNK